MRNDHVQTHVPIHPKTIRYKTLHAILEQNISNLIFAPGSFELPSDIWLPPPPVMVKLNFDGLFNLMTQLKQHMQARFKQITQLKRNSKL